MDLLRLLVLLLGLTLVHQTVISPKCMKLLSDNLCGPLDLHWSHSNGWEGRCAGVHSHRQISTYIENNCPENASPPPPPRPPSRLASSNVFWHGERATNVNITYPCIRIPSIVLAETRLIAFAECRFWIGDGCYPLPGKVLRPQNSRRDICMKYSDNNGVSWSSLRTILTNADQPTAVWDNITKTVVLQGNFGDRAFKNGQILSTDRGETWSKPVGLDKALGPIAVGSDVGPGVGLQLRSSNPHHPGRLLFIGHHGPYHYDCIWYSDDHGATYQVAKEAKTGKVLQLDHMDEAQLVELPNGDIHANMRNNHYNKTCDCRGISLSTDGGSTFGAIAYDPALVSPVCMATVLAPFPSKPADVYFANPGNKHQRANGVVKLSVDGTKTWSKNLTVNEGGAYAYSCLTAVNKPGYVGLLWETALPNGGCEKKSTSCNVVFSLVPSNLEM